MNRQPSAAARLKIGQPQLISSTRSFGDDSPFQSFPAGPSAAGRAGIGSGSASGSYGQGNGGNGNGSANGNGGPSSSYNSPVPSAPPRPRESGEHARAQAQVVQGMQGTPGASSSNGGSPARPARSRLRDAPPVPDDGGPGYAGGGSYGHSRAPSASSSHIPPPRPERERERERPDRSRLHLQTANLRRPSHDAQLSPITATSPVDHSAPMSFSDPFAADRSQRTELRAQTSAAQQAKMAVQTSAGGGGPGNDKLRNVVGAFMAASKSASGASDPRRPQRSEARKPRREETWELDNQGGEFGDMDAVLRKIKKEWPFVLESDFSPSTLALSLLSQGTSLPAHPSLSSFQRLHESLSAALQGAVQAHFQTFAASLPQHASFLGTLGRAQEQVRQSKRELNEARDGFAGKAKGELAGVRARERQVRDMLKILDTIDELKGVPDRLETLIGDKKFIQAAVLLVQSAKTISKPEIAEIGAMAELTAYFASQETTLSDILVEELHSHIYLKTFYSESRWSMYTPGQTKRELEPQQLLTAVQSDKRFAHYIQSLHTKPSQDPMLEMDVRMGQAPSSASLASLAEPEIVEEYVYIETLLEALAVLGRLGGALERVTQRVSSEIHILIEATLDEVEERVEQRRTEAEGAIANTLDVGGPPQHAAVLRDLFWTLYSKLAAVLEGHRIVYEVARWISSRRDFKDHAIKGSANLNIPVVEIYKPVQNAVRTLLRSYLIDSRSSLEVRPLMSINEILREGRIARDRQKPLFKFSDTDTRAVASDVKEMDDNLQQVLRASVPGLLQAEASIEENDETHRNLVPANVFNVTTLFQPTVALIERADAIVPPGFVEESRAFSSVLEDFVVGVFLPQLDERVTSSFQQAVSGYDAYQIDRKLAGTVKKPPLKSSVRVMGLVHNLCVMLLTTPFHRENYSRLIVGVVVQYYQQCSARFKDLASLGGGETLSLPATWAQREDVIEVLKEVQAVVPSDRQELALISQRELKLQNDMLKTKVVVERELINSPRKFEALGQLAESLRWFIDSLLDIQISADEPIADVSVPKLPLTQAMSQRFDAIIQTYEQLTEMVLNTMRLEVRARMLCNLGASMRAGDFYLESEALELDPDVVDLNAHLVESEELVTETLAEEDRVFIVRGLSHLADSIFVSSAKAIKVINAAGVGKIRRNILSLQQCLRGVSRSDDVLVRSMAYWDLYAAGPKRMLEDLRAGRPQFTFEEYVTMLNLQCKTTQADAPSSELNTYLIDLHALSMEIVGWEIGEV